MMPLCGCNEGDCAMRLIYSHVCGISRSRKSHYTIVYICVYLHGTEYKERSGHGLASSSNNNDKREREREQTGNMILVVVVYQ